MRLRGKVYRAHHPRWAYLATSGEGAALHGGRFNPKGMAALYTSRRLETAWLEAQQGFPFKAQPMTICAYAVDCEDVLDLTDEAERVGQGVSIADLACSWEDMTSRGLTPPSWTLTDRLRGQGAAGILVPSFAPGAGPLDANAVFWRWSDSPPHQIRVIDDLNRLPRDDASWR